MNGFSLWVGLGASLGLWRLWRSAPKQQADAWVNAGLAVLAAALAGARLFYTLINWPYFLARPLEIFKLWEGGLDWEGALIGAILVYLGLGFFGNASGERSLTAIGDQLYPLMPPLAVAAWVGCWQSGAAHGIEIAEDAWWGMRALGETLPGALYFPLQPLAALSLLLFFWLLETRVEAMRPPGRLSGIATGGLLLHLLVTSLFTGSPAPSWNGMRVDTFFALSALTLLLTLTLTRALLARIPRRQVSSSIE